MLEQLATLPEWARLALQQFAIALITGIVIAVLTVWLSLRRFRKERWWERKVEAYQRIIEALHHSKAFSDQHLDAEMSGRDVSEEKDKLLRERSQAAHDEIYKATDIGAFLLPDEAIKRLRQYKKDADKASDTTMWFEYLESDLSVTSDCLKDMINIAKRDLDTQGPWWNRLQVKPWSHSS